MTDQPSKATDHKRHAKVGPLIIVSGPSGSGKSTVIARVLDEARVALHLSVSATTRSPRASEKDGKDYKFWTREEFERQIHAEGFLEWAHVHGHLYGTLKSEVFPYRERGIGVILDIDVQGAETIRRVCPANVSVFLRTKSMETYEQRLRCRGTENEESLKRRLAAAQGELARALAYDFQVVNEDLDTAVRDLRAIVEAQFEGS
jgi:guanylate kinase